MRGSLWHATARGRKEPPPPPPPPSLTLPERVALLQEWILPLLIVPARPYFPTKEVCSKLADIYRTALRVSGWGLILDRGGGMQIEIAKNAMQKNANKCK